MHYQRRRRHGSLELPVPALDRPGYRARRRDPFGSTACQQAIVELLRTVPDKEVNNSFIHEQLTARGISFSRSIINQSLGFLVLKGVVLRVERGWYTIAIKEQQP